MAVTVAVMSPKSAEQAEPAALDLNSCTAAELSGILTVAKAEAIVKHREAHGSFTSWKAVEGVKGVSVRTTEKLRAAGVLLPEAALAPYENPQPSHGSTQHAKRRPHGHSAGVSASQNSKPLKAGKPQVAHQQVHASFSAPDWSKTPSRKQPGQHPLAKLFHQLFGQHHKSSPGNATASNKPARRPFSSQSQAPLPHDASAPTDPPSRLSNCLNDDDASATLNDAPDEQTSGKLPEGGWWWERCDDPSAPFPPEFAGNPRKPTSYNYIRLASADQPGQMVYNGRLLSLEEAKALQEAWKSRWACKCDC